MAKATSFDRLVEEYDGGARCFACRQPITATGCPCSKTRLYGDRHAEVLAWYESLPASIQNPKKGFRALPAVLSALTAERIKAGLHDLPLDPERPQGPTVAQDERMGTYAQVGIDPRKAKWRKGDLGPERRPYRQRPGVNPPTAGGLGGRAVVPTTTVRRAS